MTTKPSDHDDLRNALLHLATTLNSTQFKALSVGLGLGQVRSRPAKAKEIPHRTKDPRPTPQPSKTSIASADQQGKPGGANAVHPWSRSSGKMRGEKHLELTLVARRTPTHSTLRFLAIHVTDVILLAASLTVSLIVVNFVLSDQSFSLVDAVATLQRWYGFFSVPELLLGLYGVFCVYFAFFKILAGQTPAQGLMKRVFD